jgi:SAM-dependent methyltransferase
MDSITSYNRDRWNDLANAGVMYSQPFLDWTVEKAQAFVGRHQILSDVRGKRVLCLGGGGGQDSVAFALAGADVTVFDLSDVQLERDRESAARYHFPLKTVQGDMRDLSMFTADAFDIVWQPFSINYSPQIGPVIIGVSRILTNSGIYHLAFANPFTQALDEDSWNGTGYLLRGRYIDGEDISIYEPTWSVSQADGSQVTIKAPYQYRHTLGTVLNTLARNDFIFLFLKEWENRKENPAPGTWEHCAQCAPKFFESFWRNDKSLPRPNGSDHPGSKKAPYG